MSFYNQARALIFPVLCWGCLAAMQLSQHRSGVNAAPPHALAARLRLQLPVTNAVSHLSAHTLPLSDLTCWALRGSMVDHRWCDSDRGAAVNSAVPAALHVC